MIRPLAFAVALALSPVAMAGVSLSDGSVCYDKTCFVSSVKTEESAMQLRGVSLLRYWGFRVYTAALYMPEAVPSERVLDGDVPRRLVLNYHRGIDRKDIVRAKFKLLEKNPNVDLEAIRERVEKMNAVYRSVKEDDRYELVYEPGKGTTLIYNGQVELTVEGEDFAAAIFGIWLSSDYSLNEGFTSDLLEPYQRRL